MILAALAASIDQTNDAALVLRFADAIRRGADAEAQAMLSPRVFIGDYRQSSRTSLSEFARYARGCSLAKVTLVTNANRRMPIGLQWNCRYPEDARTASFWFEGQRISRIGWGEPPVIVLPSTRRD